MYVYVYNSRNGGRLVAANMEVASSDDVGFVEVFDRLGRGLDVQFSLFSCGKEMPLQNLPRVSRGETL